MNRPKLQPFELVEDELVHSSSMLKAISHPARLMILSLLLEKEKFVGEIQEETGFSQPTISRYLQQLMDTGLVRRRKDGARAYYSVSSTEIINLLDSLKNAVDDCVNKGWIIGE